MESGRVYRGSNMTSSILQNERLPCSNSEVLESLWLSNSSPSFHGSTSIVKFDDARGGNTADRLLFPPIDNEENGNEDYDGCFHQPEKKRRLSIDQVQFLERNFEVENKLEPERKVQLAKELGLQARQVAIWFQNRRARFKTKQLEKDYDSLKSSFDKLKADYDCLLKENENLKNEVLLLTDKHFLREEDKTNVEQFDPIKPVDAEPNRPNLDTVSENLSNVPMVVCKQEDASSAASAKSDVFDSESPRYADGHRFSLLEPANSSHVFEPDQSDFSQDEEDNLGRSLSPPPCLPKLEDGCYDDTPVNCYYLGFPVEDQASWMWPF